MKGGILIGLMGVLVGLSLMLKGQQLCRTSCWVDNVFKLFLPDGYDHLAGGFPWIVVGIAIIVHSIWKPPRQ